MGWSGEITPVNIEWELLKEEVKDAEVYEAVKEIYGRLPRD